MKENLTELVYILDMSGSMGSLRDDTIGGYNTLLNDQKREEGEAVVTTVLFDDRYIVLHDRVNIKDIPEITDKEYAPLGTTALLDAVGKTISHIGDVINHMEEDEKPSKVMVTIITDGYENDSKEYTWASVKSMIEEQRNKYSWVISFIGANVDPFEVAQQMGIDSKLAKGYTASKIGTSSIYKAMSASTSFYRETTACLDSLSDSLSDIMDKELI